jgi:hypothetical protein
MRMLRSIVDKVFVRRKPHSELQAGQALLLVRPDARKRGSSPAPGGLSDARVDARMSGVDERSTPALLRAKTRRRN